VNKCPTKLLAQCDPVANISATQNLEFLIDVKDDIKILVEESNQVDASYKKWKHFTTAE
jgi:hypothetical protein